MEIYVGIEIKMPLKNRGEAKTYRIIFVVVSFQKQLSKGNK